MAAKKRKPPVRRARKNPDASSLVPRASDAARAIVVEGERAYVQLPLSPEGIRLVKERMGSLGDLFEAATGVISALSEVDEKVAKLVNGAIAIAGVLSGDVAKIRGRGRRRR